MTMTMSANHSVFKGSADAFPSPETLDSFLILNLGLRKSVGNSCDYDMQENYIYLTSIYQQSF